jgi:serine/threonine protein kinase
MASLTQRHPQTPLFPSFLKRYLKSHKTKRFDLRTVLSRPTSFVSDNNLMEQLSPANSWTHVASGGFGNVFLCKWLGVDAICKWNDHQNDIEEDDNDEFLNFEEFILGSSMNHPHVVQFFVASPSAIVMEHMQGGSLSTKIRTCSIPSLEQRTTWCSHLVSAVRYVHTFGVVHGDISVDNVLFTNNHVLKLSDFGASWFACRAETDKITTDRYMPLTLLAPDADIERDLGYHTDRYAMVCVILNILDWNSDIYDICGLSFFERGLMQAQDKYKYLTESLSLAVREVWRKLASIDEECQKILFQFFVSPGMDMCDTDTLKFIIDKIGPKHTWTDDTTAIRNLQAHLLCQ